MGTRGALGFISNGVHKVTYNHFDSYPSELGLNVLRFCRESKLEGLYKTFNAITMVDERSKPTTEQKVKIDPQYTDLSVSSQSNDDWYCLLRNAQGDLKAYGEIGFMIDSQNFLHDSLFCEWAYIVNLDNNTLEVYEGFQKSKPTGRYTDVEPNNGYYAVSLIKEYQLNRLPSDDQFLEEFKEKEE